jgi:hypothetical protein
VDQQANRGAKTNPGATLNPGRLNGSPGVSTFLKITALESHIGALESDIGAEWPGAPSNTEQSSPIAMVLSLAEDGVRAE